MKVKAHFKAKRETGKVVTSLGRCWRKGRQANEVSGSVQIVTMTIWSLCLITTWEDLHIFINDLSAFILEGVEMLASISVEEKTYVTTQPSLVYAGKIKVSWSASLSSLKSYCLLAGQVNFSHSCVSVKKLIENHLRNNFRIVSNSDQQSRPKIQVYSQNLTCDHILLLGNPPEEENVSQRSRFRPGIQNMGSLLHCNAGPNDHHWSLTQLWSHS